MRRVRWPWIAAAVLLGLIPLLVLATRSLTVRERQPPAPIRAAFYYPWFPEAWSIGGVGPYTEYTPALGQYDSSNPDLIRRHIAAMQYGRIDAGILSWWGRGSRTDGRVPDILNATAGSGFHWAIYYEGESLGDPSADAIHEDLLYIRDHYAGSPAFLRIDGRFVVFVYAEEKDACDMVERWTQANADVGAYLVLKVFPGYRACPSQPGAWHQYAPAKATDAQGQDSFTISPGFHKFGEAVRLPARPRPLAREHPLDGRLWRALPVDHLFQRMGRRDRGRTGRGMGQSFGVRALPGCTAR